MLLVKTMHSGFQTESPLTATVQTDGNRHAQQRNHEWIQTTGSGRAFQEPGLFLARLTGSLYAIAKTGLYQLTDEHRTHGHLSVPAVRVESSIQLWRNARRYTFYFLTS